MIKMKWKCPKDGEEVEAEIPFPAPENFGVFCPKCGKMKIFRKGVDY